MKRPIHITLAALLLAASPTRPEQHGGPAIAAAPPKALPEMEVGGIAMIRIPEGCYLMGSPRGERGRDDDEVQHETCVGAFWMARHETTNAQFRRFRPRHSSKGFRGFTLNDPEQPVVRVSYEDADAYTRWLSGLTGRRFRLPTEAEWEYAARAGTETARFWGEGMEDACDYENSASKALLPLVYYVALSTCEDGYSVTAPVGHFKPNAYGLHDMLGNAWEMTCSKYEVEYQGDELTCAEEVTGTTRMAHRGGSWTNMAYRVRTAARTSSHAHYMNRNVGFRVVMEIAEGE